MSLMRRFSQEIKPRKIKKIPISKPKAPWVLLEEEKAGAAFLDRVWLRLQAHGRYRDKLTTKRAKAGYISGEILWETMFIVQKLQTRLENGYYREAGQPKLRRATSKRAGHVAKRKVIIV